MSGAASRMRNELAKEVRPDNETKQCGGTSRRRFWRLTIKIRRLYLVSAAVAYDEDAALAVSRFVLCRRRRRRRRPPRLTGSVNVGCAGGSGSPSSSFTDVAVAPCY